MSEQSTVVEVSGIRKTYGATIALDGASLRVASGTVHALLGENGAGKSTMVKILSGLVQPDSGEISISGEVRRLGSPRLAQSYGLQTAFQEMTQVRDLTVTQNLLLNSEPVSAFGFVRKRLAEEIAVAHLKKLGLGFIDPRAEVRDLDLPVRQKLEIARAVFQQPKLLRSHLFGAVWLVPRHDHSLGQTRHRYGLPFPIVPYSRRSSPTAAAPAMAELPAATRLRI